MINGIDYLKKVYPGRDDKDYQPSGLDLRVGRVYVMDDSLPSGLVNGQKIIPSYWRVEPKDFPKYGFKDAWKIECDTPYIFEVDEPIKIGENNAQFYLPRSSLLRCGVNVCTALGDLGYNGHLSFLVINHRFEDFYISKGERFAQLVDFEVQGGSESYDGDYQDDRHK